MKVRLSRRDENEVVAWFIRNLRDRPGDFVADAYTIKDRCGGPALWIASGRPFLSVYLPHETKRFRWLNRRRLWRAVRHHRDVYRRRAIAEIKRAMWISATFVERKAS